VAEVRGLDERSLSSHVRGQITGQVTGVDGSRSAFLEDASGGIFIDRPNIEAGLKRGQ
jgi:hypothetical protein